MGVPPLLGPRSRTCPRGACGVGIGAAFEQETDHRHVAKARREAERRRAVLIIDGVDVGAVIEQKRGFAQVAGVRQS